MAGKIALEHYKHIFVTRSKYEFFYKYNIIKSKIEMNHCMRELMGLTIFPAINATSISESITKYKNGRVALNSTGSSWYKFPGM